MCCVKLLQLCPTLCGPMYCSLPGSSVHGVIQGRILKWVCWALLQGIFSTQGSNHIICGSHIVGGLSTAEPPGKPHLIYILGKYFSTVSH